MNAESNLKYLLIFSVGNKSIFKSHVSSSINSKVSCFGYNSPVSVKKTVSLPPDHISLELKLHDFTILNKGQNQESHQ